MFHLLISMVIVAYFEKIESNFSLSLYNIFPFLFLSENEQNEGKGKSRSEGLGSIPLAVWSMKKTRISCYM